MLMEPGPDGLAQFVEPEANDGVIRVWDHQAVGTRGSCSLQRLEIGRGTDAILAAADQQGGGFLSSNVLWPGGSLLTAATDAKSMP